MFWVLGSLRKERKQSWLKKRRLSFYRRRFFIFFWERVLNHECRGAYSIEGYKEVFVWFGGKATERGGALSSEATSYRTG